MTKPTVEELGIDVGAQTWHRSGGRDGSIEVAFVGMAPRGAAAGGSACPGPASAAAAGEWVLVRVAADPAGRVLVYDRFEWECFLDGVKKGEFDDATGLPEPMGRSGSHGQVGTEWPGNPVRVSTPDGTIMPT